MYQKNQKLLLFLCFFSFLPAFVPSALADSVVVFNEIMYHPAANEPLLEWIEFHNQMALDVDMSRWSVQGGVNFVFPEGTIIPGGGYLVLAVSPADLQAQSGYAGACGPWQSGDRLSNSGEELILRNNAGRIMDQITYGDSGSWPVAPDGSGVSLAKKNPDSASEPAENWTYSAQVGGTPGEENFPSEIVLGDPVTLLPIDGTWRYNQTGSNLGTSWYQTTHPVNGSTWFQGQGLFGVAASALPEPIRTPLTVSSSKISYYFETEFDFTGDPGAVQLYLNHIIDDGAVVYLNGTEVYRRYLPGGTIAYNTYASQAVPDAESSGEIPISPAALIQGTNVLSVEVHQIERFTVTTPTLIEIGGDDGSGGVPDNLSLQNGAVAFAKDCLSGYSIHQIPHLNDGSYGNSNSWIANSAYSFAGINLNGTFSIDRIAWGRANDSSFPDRCLGTYILQYTTVANPDETTPSGSWTTFHTVTYDYSTPTPYLRHLYQFPPIANVTGVRIVVSDSGTCIDEIEIYQADAADIVFGAELNCREIIDPYGPVRMNEVAPANAASFWLEFINDSEASVDLEGYVLRCAGETDGEYVFPSQSLAGGQRLAVNETTLGFHPADEDKLFLYLPSQISVADAAVVKNSPRARFPEATGNWQYPDSGTPGTANSFAFHDEIVINEIMYYPRPLQPTEAVAGTYDTTSLIAIDNGTAWRYNQSGIDLGTGWSAVAHPSWLEGKALLAYETAALPEPIRTTLAVSSSRIVYYFETEFEFSGDPATTELQLRHIIDDGAVFYLNGVEVLRYNLSEGATFATLAVDNAVYSEYETIAADSLLVGTNRLSVEVRQQSTTSSDVVFGVELQAAIQITPPIPALPYRESQEEWIELYNRSDHAVDLSGWKIRDAIDFDFPSSTTIASNGYLVIARNAATLQAKYPNIDIMGDYDGQLANGGENIHLIDENGNTADEVRYYDGDPWPGYADGYSASLELRNPWADNTKPEAWAASNEGSGSTWNTYSYSGTATQGFGPTQWNEYILGLLNDGEVLLDDIRVIEDPQGAAVEVMQNGSFEADSIGSSPAHWRIIGNHRGQVAADPDNPSNKVLHLTATGDTDFRHNHAETTFAGNRAIVDGGEYQISFKAKWLGGVNLLNSRIYFIRLANTIELEVPAYNGTPGEQNSRYEANLGPTFSQLSHSPAVPEIYEQVTISVTAEDPDGIHYCRLWWRLDGGSWASQDMNHQGDGLYSALIPVQAAGAVVQFYVEAQDSLGAVSYYPTAGPDSRALYQVQDGRAFAGGLQNFRVILLAADNNTLFTYTNLMSNQLLGCTVVYNEKEVYYNTGVRLKGSPAGRARDGDAYQSYIVHFPKDHLFRGVHASVGVDRSGRCPVVRGQDEIYIKHMFNHAGIPSMYDDLVYLIVPKTSHIGSALLMMARYEDVFLDSWWENGSDGTVFNLDYTYHPVTTVDGNPESLKPPMPDGEIATDFVYFGQDKETYRWPMQIKNNYRKDDFSGLINFCKTLALPSAQLQQQIENVMDVDEVARCMALGSLCGIADSYFTGAVHNLRVFVRPDQKVVALPWDMDFVFCAGTASPVLSAAGKIQQIFQLPGYRRLYYGHLQDLVNTTFNTTYMAYWMAHYSSLLPGQDFTPQLSYIQARGDYALTQLPAQVPFAITTNSGTDFSVDTTGITLAGTGWINVRTLRWAEQNQPLTVTWTSDSTWEVNIPLEPGANLITLQAFDFQGSSLTSDSITVTSTVAQRPLRQYLRVTELMYAPLGESDYEFIEFCNTGPETLDLTSLYFSSGITFAFAGSGITSLASGEYLVLAKNPTVFASRYNISGMNLVGPYDGKFANEGETVRLKGQYDALVLEFEYQDSRGWPPAADGPGHSLVPLASAIAQQDLGSLYYGGNWRASTYRNGSPGQADPAAPASLLLNEIMAHTDYTNPAYSDYDSNDWIELYNPTDSALTLAAGQWYLSDDGANLAKWPIPAAVIPAHGRLSFDEITGFHHPLTSGFGLDQAGEAVYLCHLPGTAADRVADCVKFKGQSELASWGRFPDGDSYWQALPPSRDLANQPPTDHASVSELMYYPLHLSANEKYIELYNPTAQPLALWDFGLAAGWRLDGGIAYTFGMDTVIPAYGYLLVVDFIPTPENLAAFQSHYGATAAPIVGPYTGSLSHYSSRVALERPQASDDPANPQALSWIIVDEMIYSNLLPWPPAASGTGQSLQRIWLAQPGNDPAAWLAASPTPGAFASVHADFDHNGTVDLADFAILAAAWQSTAQDPQWNAACDLSTPADNTIDLSDLAAYLDYWLWQAPSLP